MKRTKTLGLGLGDARFYHYARRFSSRAHLVRGINHAPWVTTRRSFTLAMRVGLGWAKECSPRVRVSRYFNRRPTTQELWLARHW